MKNKEYRLQEYRLLLRALPWLVKGLERKINKGTVYPDDLNRLISAIGQYLDTGH